mmetsp:Transcript_48059/g.160154  ORF Transcript_48059/g.160154 Transcript_48059/m.160154 type:complete len:503 (-) Transcript_48059:95-1603(-)
MRESPQGAPHLVGERVDVGAKGGAVEQKVELDLERRVVRAIARRVKPVPGRICPREGRAGVAPLARDAHPIALHLEGGGGAVEADVLRRGAAALARVPRPPVEVARPLTHDRKAHSLGQLRVPRAGALRQLAEGAAAQRAEVDPRLRLRGGIPGKSRETVRGWPPLGTRRRGVETGRAPLHVRAPIWRRVERRGRRAPRHVGVEEAAERRALVPTGARRGELGRCRRRRGRLDASDLGQQSRQRGHLGQASGEQLRVQAVGAARPLQQAAQVWAGQVGLQPQQEPACQLWKAGDEARVELARRRATQCGTALREVRVQADGHRDGGESLWRPADGRLGLEEVGERLFEVSLPLLHRGDRGLHLSKLLVLGADHPRSDRAGVRPRLAHGGGDGGGGVQRLAWLRLCMRQAVNQPVVDRQGHRYVCRDCGLKEGLMIATGARTPGVEANGVGSQPAHFGEVCAACSPHRSKILCEEVGGRVDAGGMEAASQGVGRRGVVGEATK